MNVYDSNKHYEVAPVLSMTEHEANNSLIWVSDKLWSSLTAEQQGWVQAAASEVGAKQPAQSVELDHKSLAKLQKLGVKIVRDVDKDSFIKVASPLQDKIAAGPRPARGADPADHPLHPVGARWRTTISSCRRNAT